MSRLQTYLFIIHIWDILNRNPFSRSVVILMQGSLKIWTEHSPNLLGAEVRKDTGSFGGFFGPWLFIILVSQIKIFLMSPLKVGFRVSQTWSFFEKFRILESYYNQRTRQDSDFAKFWPMANVKMYQALTFDMPKKLLSQHFTKIELLYSPE